MAPASRQREAATGRQVRLLWLRADSGFRRYARNLRMASFYLGRNPGQIQCAGVAHRPPHLQKEKGRQMKPNHTPEQRRRLFALARLLDRVPKGHFNMSAWLSAPSDVMYETEATRAAKLAAHECGYAGCAIGWGMTSRAVRGNCTSAVQLVSQLMARQERSTDWIRLFGPNRTVGPKRVAADIRRYLKDGMLPR